MGTERKDRIFETAGPKEQVILAAASTGSQDDTEASLAELSELARTAGAIVVGTLIQRLEAVHPGTYLGKGKIEELAVLIEELGATGVICDDELSPAQAANLCEELGIKVIDRTVLILDIFAARASTREGKIQVELAQLRYRATRLTGYGQALSRLGGGIGTRGPGEKKLEVDRRLIRERISRLKGELAQVERHRDTARDRRESSALPTVAIVGYTNAGKSTLLNTLTGAEVLEEDKLFATLDPTTRSLVLPGGQQVLLTDTVGFIRKLPHHLIDAFHSTLEEAGYADIIIHMVDASNPDMDMQMTVVYDTLDQLKIRGKTILTAFNKTDLLPANQDRTEFRDYRADACVQICARDRESLEPLLLILEEELRKKKIYLEQVFDYRQAGDIAQIRKYGQLLAEEYTQGGILVKAYVPADVYGRLQKRQHGEKES